MKYLSDKETAISEVIQEAVALSELDVPSPVRVSLVEYDDEPPLTKKQCGLGKILENCLGTSTVTDEDDLSCQERVEREIERYQDYPSVDVNCDLLQWWKQEQRRLPSLAGVAHTYLCICGTSVPSERLFSKGGVIVSDLRNGLSPDHVNILLFLSNNMP